VLPVPAWGSPVALQEVGKRVKDQSMSRLMRGKAVVMLTRKRVAARRHRRREEGNMVVGL
jgi:hypothetical protein